MSSDSDDSSYNISTALQTHTSRSVKRNVENNRKRMHSSACSASQRAAKRGNETFYAEGDTLLCRVCCKIIDHSRQSTLDRHKKSDSHVKNKSKGIIQKTLTTTFPVPNQAKLENVILINAWVRTCAATNAPLFITDNMDNNFLWNMLNVEAQFLNRAH